MECRASSSRLINSFRCIDSFRCLHAPCTNLAAGVSARHLYSPQCKVIKLDAHPTSTETVPVENHSNADNNVPNRTAEVPKPSNLSTLPDMDPAESSTAPPSTQEPVLEDAASLLLSTLDGEIAAQEEEKSISPAIGIAIMLGGVLALLGGGYLLKDQIQAFLSFFISAVDDWGPWGYLAYAATYTTLEVLAIPAIPLTMTAGAIFGPAAGTLIVSLSGTLAATISFLIARYIARDKILKFAKKNKKFAAIDRAIGRDSFKFVTLLRLSPLLPLSASNYLYGLTSVELGPYILGSFLGMLPGTYAFVGTGHVGKAVLEGGKSLSMDSYQVGLGLLGTAVALAFIGRLAKQALEEVDAESSST
ncbi:hypothetical protein CEUSTIGMA_g7252.t1 [Chlamydomonas eustigma]|uniref:VTT domain-containing protein n=1 Tax=Chlamydomonas eustigma TaxID=1157962 RepID=A0A250XAC2_9CHLO|nr:hypothetical protein CEUSTIGMA_g7252.t1 [Chlamydomonas eustigma]|eukprot:GAX79812.1 hypothetical protein CEUSTIGMA_g7252.t1 [Chlamydomonas eustigma]